MTTVSDAAQRLSNWLDRRKILSVGLAGLATLANAQTSEAKSMKSIDVVKNIILAWRKLDVEGVMKYISDDTVWYSHVGGKPPFKGRAAIREFITALGKGITDNNWRVFKMVSSGEDVFCEGVDDFKLADGKKIAVPYLGIMTVRNGIVIEWRDYFDGAMVDKMKRGEFDFNADPIAPLIERKALF
jgi:limonene-1,2-epoxide hydrolase